MYKFFPKQLEALLKTAHQLIDQLTLQGVEVFCIAPGSRSAPLALAAKEHPKAQIHVHFDERGLAFFALGLAMASKKPVAIIVTSGTAVANLIPAACEAFASGQPVLFLTADRPAELHDCGANQTIDQTRLFSSIVRWQADLSTDLDEKTIRSLAAQAVFYATGRESGPVHINCRFREPFDLRQVKAGPGKTFFTSSSTLTAPLFERSEKRGLIAAGPLREDPAPIEALAKRLKWPIFADVLSGIHAPEQIIHFDRLLGSEKPELVLHFGDRLTSKNFSSWIQEVPTFHIGNRKNLVDPGRSLEGRIFSDIAPFCETFKAKTDPMWLKLWKQKDLEQEAILEKTLSETPFCEAHALRLLSKTWTQGSCFFGNSLPIRHANAYFSPAKELRCFANRGVSGIDGTVATAAGIAAATQEPVLAWIGDQSVLYDLNSFALLKNLKLTLVIVNNSGGGIFSYLPYVSSPHFDQLFTHQHNWNFQGAAEMFEIPYLRVEGSFPKTVSPGIIELITTKDTSLCLSRLLSHA